MDKKALSLLKKYYSGSDYTNKVRIPSAEELKYCIEHGTMFENFKMSHSEMVKQTIDLVSRITLEAAAKAFLYSLSTGKNEYRTILSSYIFAQKLYKHECTFGYRRESQRKDVCGICGFSNNTYDAIACYVYDINIISSRYK